MHALLYASAAEPALTDTELELVLLKSRTLNAARGITGALLKRGSRIVQYLEGERQALDRTFERIAASPLHRDVNVIARADGVSRVFDRWHMGFRDFQPLHSRSTATEDWHDAVALAQAASPDNEPARLLLAQWDALARPA